MSAPDPGALDQLIREAGGTMVLMVFTDAAGDEWGSSAIAAPAVRLRDDETMDLHSSAEAGLRLTNITILEP